MRKFLLTLAVLCGTVSAWAEFYKPGSRTTTLEAGKKYFISVATWYGSGCTNLLYNNGGTLAKSDLLPNVMVNNESYLFTVEEVDEDNTYYIKNSEGKYLQSEDLASTETKTGITVVPYNRVKGSVTCGNDVQACAADGTKIEYDDITDATPIVCVYSSNDKGWRYINSLQIGKSTPFAFYEVETVTEFGEVTTDPSSPILYTIKNIRANAYAEYDGAARAMNLKNSVTNASNLFYFTAGATEGTYKIHNYATTKLCAETNSWNETGTDWYIKASENTTYAGWAISKEETLTAATEQAWNDFQGAHTSVAYWGGNDDGSVWTIEKFEGEVPTIKMSTDSEKFLYFIKNDRVNKYANYSASGTAFAEGASTNYGSYWYFVEKADAEGVPAGFKACYIYNAANNLPVQNHSNGFMSAPDDANYPAKVYYVGSHENTYWGYVIYESTNSGNAWNDHASSSVTGYSYDDAGSIWSIIPADKTEATLKNEATTAKTNALNYIELAELADYYTYSDEAIATAKAAVEEIDTDDLASAVSSLLAGSAESNLSTLKESARGTDAPAPGDYIQLKNRQYGKFLKANDADLTNVSAANDYATLWQVETGDGTNVKLKNAATGKYIGQIRQSASVGMVDEANAKQFAFTNQTDIYAVFKETTGGDYAYGHIAGGGNLVGWEPGANATQWVVSKLNIPEVGKYYVIECPLFYNRQGIRKALYSNGSNPGWKTLDIADKSFYWTVEQTDNGYVLKNAYDNKYILGQANNNDAWTMVDATDGAEYIIEPAGEGQVFIKITGRHLHANNHGGGVNNESNIVSWETNSANSASAWKFIERHMPNFYTFKNDDYYITSGVTNNNKIALSTTKDESAIYYYNGTHLLAYKTGLYMGLNATDWTFEAVGSNDISAIEFVPAVNGVPSKINIKSGGRWLHRTEAYVNRCTNNTCGDAHNWSIEEVNSLPFTFKAAALGYATFNAPVTVQLPEGVKAYTSEIQEGNKLMMTELAGGIVPANTAVLLWNESVADKDVTVDLTITENVTFKGTNSFVGTVAAENLNTEKDCYSLQKGTKGKVGFYSKSTGTKGGFKAWIEMAKSSEARAFVIIFDGEDATGIKEALGLENENVEIYDLSGRRLDKPAKGVNIIGGKTVIVR